jgi:hypothetical protein
MEDIMTAFLIVMYFVVGLVVSAFCVDEDWPEFPVIVAWPGFLFFGALHFAVLGLRKLMKMFLDKIGL